jgi:hypothetical protein
MLTNGYVQHKVRREQTRDLLCQAQRWRLLRESGLVRSMPIKRSACWLLCQTGKALVALGQQLERYGQPALVVQER